MTSSPLTIFRTASAPLIGAPQTLTASWKSPSNIALVKYWGKREGQTPANPSLSLTLDMAHTITRVTTVPVESGGKILDLNDDPVHPFIGKLDRLLEWLRTEIPVLEHFSFHVKTSNSFPHSTGIASSASGLSAFTLCLLDIVTKASGVVVAWPDMQKMASFASRMGSGSACRSVYGGFTVWGETPLLPGSSDFFAREINDRIHPVFKTMRDAILVVSTAPKSMASSRGHALMEHHPFSEARISQAAFNLTACLAALEAGDINHLATVAENEALTLHSLIMTSGGGTVLMEPTTINIIKRIQWARRNGLGVFFTLDAGPNVHLLYPESGCGEVEAFIRNELIAVAEQQQIIFDRCGDGPVEILNGNH